MDEESRAFLELGAQALRRIRGVEGTADYFRKSGYEVALHIHDKAQATLILTKDGVCTLVDCSYVHVPTPVQLWIYNRVPFSLSTEEND